ncbi:MAG: ketoacyl-ACP synthase III [Chloroflexi bacterium]|nr:ketoacyl-ACP synthase III [Chloroflexota bacterium]
MLSTYTARSVAAPSAVITGWGSYVPPRVLSNRDLESRIDTTDAWIVERTGIRERHVVEDGEATSGMAAKAARVAIERAGIAADELDAVMVATTTADHLVPTAACLVQEQIGARHAAVFDIGAACAGFVYGLAVAKGLVASGAARRVLLVAAETISRFIDWTDRSTCVLFGDGAGAVVIEASEGRGGIRGTVLRGDGTKRHALWVEGGGSLMARIPDAKDGQMFRLRMDGQEVFKLAVPSMARACEEVLAAEGLRLSDVTLLIPHQANLRIIEAVGKRLGIDRAKVFVNIERYGNTSAASIPIALCEAVEQGRVRPGDRILMCAFGGGMTWGAALVEWSGAPVAVGRKGIAARARDLLARRARRAGGSTSPRAT